MNSQNLSSAPYGVDAGLDNEEAEKYYLSPGRLKGKCLAFTTGYGGLIRHLTSTHSSTTVYLLHTGPSEAFEPLYEFCTSKPPYNHFILSPLRLQILLQTANALA